MSLLHILALSVAALSLLAVFLLFWIYHLSRQLDTTRGAVRHLEGLLRQSREAEASAHRAASSSPDDGTPTEAPTVDVPPPSRDQPTKHVPPREQDHAVPTASSPEKPPADLPPDEARWFSVFTGKGFEPVALETEAPPASATAAPSSPTPHLNVQWA